MKIIDTETSADDPSTVAAISPRANACVSPRVRTGSESAQFHSLVVSPRADVAVSPRTNAGSDSTQPLMSPERVKSVRQMLAVGNCLYSHFTVEMLVEKLN